MNELKIGDKLIDKIHGVSQIKDADHNDGILFVSDRGVIFRRALTEVQSMPPAPKEDIFLSSIKAMTIGAFVIVFVTLIVIVASKVVIVQMGQ